MAKRSSMWIAAVLAMTATAVRAQTPQEAITAAIAASDAFPPGTSIVSITVDGPNVVVDLNAEAAVGLTDSQSDAMVATVTGALGEFSELTDIEVTAGGIPLWQYLPPPPTEASAVAPAAPATAAPMAMMAFASSGATELAGKIVNLHPSHGTYYVHTDSNGNPIPSPWWAISQRTLCGPNPTTRPPGWDSLWQSVYQGSNYYYNTMGWQWPSYYEDFGTPTYASGTPEFIRFLKGYCESSGATVRVSRELDRNAGDFDSVAFGYVPAPWPTPMYRMAAMYNLQAKGYPPWIWSALATDYDADIRARPYFANYHMALDNTGGLPENDPALWGNYISIHLHTNAFTSNNQAVARGTEIYWYTSIYTYLQAKAQALASSVLSGTINAIRNEYDGFWAQTLYPPGPAPREWPTAYGTYRGYQHAGGSTTNWQNRGVKTGNYGEIREAKMPAVLMELLFHDDWKFYPDHVFEQDEIFRATTAWGMYEGICAYWSITPKPRLAAAVVSAEFPAWVKPGTAITGSVTMRNLGQAWCWGHKFVTATKTHTPYTVWQLAPQGSNPLGAAVVQIDPADVIMPGDTKTFALQLTAPSASGVYTTDLRMVKNDQRGGVFGDVASAQIGVDGTAPVITITAPQAQWYASVTPMFDATDDLSGVISLVGTIDGGVVNSGEPVSLADGEHTLVVTALDNAGNSATESVTFQVDGAPPVITIGSPAALDYPYGCVAVGFEATDAGSGVSSVDATLDGYSVSDGDAMCYLALGSHTLVVTAVDEVGNTATKSVTFKIVNTPGKTTAGGWIELANKKGTCGITCSYVDGEAAPTGNVTYQDHDTGMTVQSVDMVAMGVRDNKASIYGTCTIDGEPGHWFRIDMTDNGEPGNTDVFNIQLDTGYKAGGLLGGGNITIH